MTNREWVSNLSDEQRANFTSDIGTSGSVEACEACPVFEFCFNYCQDKEVTCCDEVVGWHISNLKIYDKPKELDEFYKQGTPTFEEYLSNTYSNGNYEALLRANRIPRPPQSWCYVEEI